MKQIITQITFKIKELKDLLPTSNFLYLQSLIFIQYSAQDPIFHTIVQMIVLWFCLPFSSKDLHFGLIHLFFYINSV